MDASTGKGQPDSAWKSVGRITPAPHPRGGLCAETAEWLRLKELRGHVNYRRLERSPLFGDASPPPYGRLDTWLQACIIGFGLPAVLLLNLGVGWAPLLGLASQPAWLWATARKRQWGMFGLSCVYTAVWLVGAARWLWGS